MATKFEYFDETYDSENSGTSTTWIAQTITPATSHSATYVRLSLRRYGSETPGQVTAAIYPTTGGAPDCSSAALASGTTDGNTLTNNEAGEKRTITFSSPTNLVASTVYAIVVYGSSASPNVIRWKTVTAGGYAGGEDYYSNDSGSTWSEFTTTRDFLFEVWGYTHVYPTEQTGDIEYAGLTRVTNIIHRYNRAQGVYTLELNLGEVTTDFGLPEWAAKPLASSPEKQEKDELKDLQDKILPDWFKYMKFPGAAGVPQEVTELPVARVEPSPELLKSVDIQKTKDRIAVLQKIIADPATAQMRHYALVEIRQLRDYLEFLKG